MQGYRIATLMGVMYFLVEMPKKEFYFSRSITVIGNAQPADILQLEVKDNRDTDRILRDYCNGRKRRISKFDEYTCICEKTFRRKNKLWEHMLHHHCLIETIDVNPWKQEGYLYCDSEECDKVQRRFHEQQEREFKNLRR